VTFGFGIKTSVALAIFIVTSLGASLSTIITTVVSGFDAGIEEGKSQLLVVKKLIDDIVSSFTGTVSVARNVVGAMANISKAVFEVSSSKIGVAFLLFSFFAVYVATTSYFN
jgi:hypothetical protein